VPTHIEPQSGTRREALQIPHSRLAPTATNPYRQGEGGTNTYLQGTAPPPPPPPKPPPPPSCPQRGCLLQPNQVVVTVVTCSWFLPFQWPVYVSFVVRFFPTRRARWPGHKPICIDRDGPDLCIDCCTQLDQPKSRLYAARALSAESPQQSAVVAYSRDFGLRPGQAVNRVPAGKNPFSNPAETKKYGWDDT
jgi:hypothetical protein